MVGGVCINSGTIPSKTLREAVLHFSGFLYQGIYGMNYRVKDKVTMSDLSFRVQHVIKTEIDVTQAQLSRNNVEVSDGVASFTTPTSVKVENSRGVQEYTAPVHRHRDRAPSRRHRRRSRSTTAPSSTATRSWTCRRFRGLSLWLAAA